MRWLSIHLPLPGSRLLVGVQWGLTRFNHYPILLFLILHFSPFESPFRSSTATLLLLPSNTRRVVTMLPHSTSNPHFGEAFRSTPVLVTFLSPVTATASQYLYLPIPWPVSLLSHPIAAGGEWTLIVIQPLPGFTGEASLPPLALLSPVLLPPNETSHTSSKTPPASP